MNDETIIQTLRQRQGDARLTDAQMAGRLGISRQLWQKLVTGERHLSLRVLRGVLDAYPDLTPQVLAIVLPRK